MVILTLQTMDNFFANSVGILGSDIAAGHLLNVIGASGYDKRNKEEV